MVTKPKLYRRKRFWAGILLAQFLLFFLASKSRFLVKIFEDFFEFQKHLHIKIFAGVDFSIGDVFYVLIGILLVFFLVKLFSKKSRHVYLLRLLQVLNIFYFVYQIFWGMLYFQTPLIEKLPEKKTTQEEIKNLAKIYLQKCKETRTKVQEDRNGVFKVYDVQEIENEILKQQKFLPKELNSKTPVLENSFKPSLFSAVMSYSGIMGYYNPFTAEAQYNPHLPSSSLPFTLAHESSHQLGYAREQEANFVGYLIGIKSKNADLRYSTEYFVLKSLLNSLVEADPEFVKQMIRSYSPEMKRDRLAGKMFVIRHEGALDTFFGFTNDLFLKSNQQEGSITYSYFLDLLLRYELNKLQ